MLVNQREPRVLTLQNGTNCRLCALGNVIREAAPSNEDLLPHMLNIWARNYEKDLDEVHVDHGLDWELITAERETLMGAYLESRVPECIAIGFMGLNEFQSTRWGSLSLPKLLLDDSESPGAVYFNAGHAMALLIHQQPAIRDTAMSAPKATTQRVRIQDETEGGAHVPFAAESAPKATAGTAVLDASASKTHRARISDAPEGSANVPFAAESAPKATQGAIVGPSCIGDARSTSCAPLAEVCSIHECERETPIITASYYAVPQNTVQTLSKDAATAILSSHGVVALFGRHTTLTQLVPALCDTLLGALEHATGLKHSAVGELAFESCVAAAFGSRVLHYEHLHLAFLLIRIWLKWGDRPVRLEPEHDRSKDSDYEHKRSVFDCVLQQAPIMLNLCTGDMTRRDVARDRVAHVLANVCCCAALRLFQ